jgi:HD superfamily phosphohydrolase
MAELKFRDPVHNFIRFGGEEVALVNLGVIQRLRGIRQLAMASLEPDFTILHTYQIKSVRESSRNDEASILVGKSPNPPGKFEEESVLFSSINERFADQYVEVYAPISWRDHAERNRRLNKLTASLKDVISSSTRGVHMNIKL